MKKKSIILIAAVAGVAVAFFLILQNNKKQNQEELALVAQENATVAVRTAAVQEEQINGSFSVNGTFLPETNAQIAAEAGGQIAEIYVKEGDRVKQGQLLARLSGDKQNVEVTNAKANLDNALSTLKRYEAAFGTGGVTAVQLDQARLQVSNARAQLQAANLRSGDTSIRSRVSGIINRKMVEVGSVIGAGTPLLEIVDISSLKLKVEVDEALVSQLQVGGPVKVVPGVTRDTLGGEITFIAPASTGALKFSVEIRIDNPEEKLRAGMYATAVFDQNGSSKVLTIPREAFVGSVSDNTVFVVKNGVAKLSRIGTGMNYGPRVQVTSGLEEGDVVVTSGQINLTDNTAVEIIK